jgi:beta-lactamase regulating signal transducer with metallopeptidase domain
MEAMQASLNAVVDWLLRSSWQAGFIAVMVLMATWLLRRLIPASARYALLLLVGARLLMPMLPQSPLSVFNLLQNPPKPSQAHFNPDPQPTGQWVIITKEPFSKSVAHLPGIAAAPRAGNFTWRIIFAIVWLAGMLFVAARIARANLRLARRLRCAAVVDDPHLLQLLASCQDEMKVKRRLPILETDAIHSPALMGLLRPRLLLPPDLRQRLTDSELRFVFLHELAHLKRHDIAIDWCLAILQALHWFNPLIALAFARARAERELARDAMVLVATDSNEQCSYGQTIVKLVEKFARLGPRPGTIGILEGNSGKTQLKRRITMIADFKRPMRGGTILAALIAVVFAFVLFTDRKIGVAAEPAAPAKEFGPQPATVAAAIDKPNAKDAKNTAAQAILDRQLPEVNFNMVGLSDALEFLRDVSGANMTIQWKALEAAGIDKAAPVTIRMRNPKFSTALKAILSDAGGGAVKLGFEIEEGVIVITTAEELSKNTTVEVYDIRDLFMSKDEKANEEHANQLMKTFEQIIDPNSWTTNGGNAGTIKHLKGQLIVTQTKENHRMVVQLLDKLREARELQIVVRSHLIKIQMKMLKELGIDIQKEGDLLKVDPKANQPGKPGKTFQGAFLDDNQVDLLLKAAQSSADATILNSPRIALFNAQQGSISIGEEIPFISDWSAPKNGKRDPKISYVKTGFIFNLQAFVSADRKFVTLNMQPRIAKLRKLDEVPWPQAPADEKLNVQKPNLAVQEVDEMVSIPDGGTLLTVLADNEDHGKDAKGPVNILLVRPSILIQREVEQKEPPAKPGF